MSWLSKGLKKVGHVIASPVKGLVHAIEDPGKWASNIAHQATDPKTLIGLASALALPGVGGALTGALGSIPVVGSTLASGAGAIGGFGGKIAGTAKGLVSHIPGASSVMGALGGAPSVGGAIPDAAIPAKGGFLSGLMGSAKGLVLGKDGKLGLDDVLNIGAGIEGVTKSRASDNYLKQALAQAQNAYAADAPYRSAAQGMLLNNPTPSLTSVYRNRQNPFAAGA